MKQWLDEMAISIIFLAVGVYGVAAYAIGNLWYILKGRLPWLK